MRYRYESWTDLDRTLEAFRWARRGLLLVTALALPFAAWQDFGARPASAHDLAPTRTVAADHHAECVPPAVRELHS